jgi:hypothetical protein
MLWGGSGHERVEITPDDNLDGVLRSLILLGWKLLQ